MNDSSTSSKENGQTSPNPSTGQPSDDFSRAVVEGLKRYGGNDDLFLKENPQFDRRIDRMYTPKEP